MKDWPPEIVKSTLEYLGGESDVQPPWFPMQLSSPFWGFWWGILAIAIIIFCGQASKFIYIDF